MPYRGSILAEQLLAAEKTTAEELDELFDIKIEKHRLGKTLNVVAPTWIMRGPLLSIDDFLEKLVDEKTKDKARRDIACLPSVSRRPFFKNPLILKNLADPDRVSPVLNLDSWGAVVTGNDIEFDWDILQPDPTAVYCLSFDFSISGDATGVALVHYSPGDTRLHLDFSFRVVTGISKRIDYTPLRKLAKTLRSKKFRISTVCFDQYQSNDSMNILEAQGFNCAIVKYGESLAGCNLLREYIETERFVYGACDVVFIGEAQELRIVNERRIDHLPSGGAHNSKDVWDAVVTASYQVLMDAKNQGSNVISAEDIQTFNPSQLEEVHPLSSVQMLYDPAKLKELQLPNNDHALIAAVSARFKASTDSDVITVALGAVHKGTNTCKVLTVRKLRGTPETLALWLRQLEFSCRNSSYYRTVEGQSLEIFIPKAPYLEGVIYAFDEVAPELFLTESDVGLSDTVRISQAQLACKAGEVQFPVGYQADEAMDSLVNQIVAYPYVPQEYTLLALELLVREAKNLDFTQMGDDDMGEVVNMNGAFGGLSR